MMRITDTVKHLLIINVVMFVGTIAIGDGLLFNKLFCCKLYVIHKIKVYELVKLKYTNFTAKFNALFL